MPQSVVKKNKKSSLAARVQEKSVLGIGRLPKPDVIGRLRAEFMEENGGKLPCGNVRVIAEALRHFENAVNMVDVCAINGVQSIHLSKHSLDIFAPPMVRQSRGNVLSIPIYQSGFGWFWILWS